MGVEARYRRRRAPFSRSHSRSVNMGRSDFCLESLCLREVFGLCSTLSPYVMGGAHFFVSCTAWWNPGLGTGRRVRVARREPDIHLAGAGDSRAPTSRALGRPIHVLIASILHLALTLLTTGSTAAIAPS